MPRQVTFIAVVAALVAGCALRPCAAADPPGAVENWADSTLPKTGNLVLWLDASRQNDARQALGGKRLQEGDKVDVWYDGSGHALHVAQAKSAWRPVYSETGGLRTIRFDGEHTFLERREIRRELHDFTLFLVAAPFSNPGAFVALMALNQAGANDYLTGLTVDQGGEATPRFQSINPEGGGFSGAANLLRDAADFGVVQRLCIAATPGEKGVELFSNGRLQGARRRGAAALKLDELRVGARYYTNGGPPEPRGFLEGDIAELLLFDRRLTDAERGAIDEYLAQKYAAAPTIARPGPRVGKRLAALANPPAVQVFMPGFTVRRLPLELTNINNLKYRADGKLMALAYNGTIYILSDTDGDKLEDRADIFWDAKGGLRGPIGFDLTPPNDPRGNGVFVASKGKCSLIIDRNADDKADEELIIAQGWREISQNVDALGVAYNPQDGSVYFGLGCTNYANAYQIGPDNETGYSLSSERGTILRVAPDFQSRAVVATGIRFPVGLRFNRQGDLFCTDQEGATWLANGNPFDELLHIQPGRHYGFPPRHPARLPNVIDEPSLFDYGPQHQSLCGFNFNEPVNGGPCFGPGDWRGDAFIAGYSRGKLYRTTLVKSAAGYVARSQLLASLNMLASEVCISPEGALVLAAHGGGPDWGDGPNGKGTLYKLLYSAPELPQPAAIWAQGPREVRIAFDRPLEPKWLKELAAGTTVEFGQYVAAGDRFEHLRPGYQVVQAQQRAPRFDLPVYSVQVSGDRRMLLLVTAPHPEASNYAVILPGLGRSDAAANEPAGLAQIAETDLHYDLCGVEARWSPAGSPPAWIGWLPHLDLQVSRLLTRSSAVHDELWSLLRRPGELKLVARLNVKDMLRPQIQPGSTIDYKWPAEQVTLEFAVPGGQRHSVRAFTESDGANHALPVESLVDHQQERVARVAAPADFAGLLTVEILLATGTGDLEHTARFHTNEDSRPRAWPLRRMFPPWTPEKRVEAPAVVDRDIPELKGGNWSRGRRVFYDAQTGCSKCHAVGGIGGALGPNLSNLPHRDYPSVLRDVLEPNYSINPDYITQVVELKSGRVLTGSVRTVNAMLEIGDQDGHVTRVAPAEVESMHSSSKSIMPEGLLKHLGPDKLRDLLMFLLKPPPHMPVYGREMPPPPRTRAEVDAVLAGPADPGPLRPLRIALVAGKKDHGVGEHDYPAWLTVWKDLLEMADATVATTAMEWPTPAELDTAQVIVLYQHGQWTVERARDIDAFLARGGGLVLIHYAVDGLDDSVGFARRIGLAWQAGQSRFRHGPLDLSFGAGAGHPIARNLHHLHLHDESYWNLAGDAKRINLLAAAPEDGRDQPLFWTFEPSNGRVFVSIPGHFAWTFDDPLFRILVLRGIAWAARAPVDRFNDLATPGARIQDVPPDVSRP